MSEETKELIHLALEFLRKTLADNDVSIAVDKETGDLIFFDTKIYLITNKFNGIRVDITSLVGDGD